MAIDSRFLTSKVARRIFFLFVLCALVPMTALAIFSFVRVSEELRTQARERLDTGVRNVGQGIAERLQLLAAELSILGDGLSGLETATAPEAEPAIPLPTASEHFLGFALVDPSGEALAVSGEVGDMPEWSDRQREHVGAGGTVLVTQPRTGEPPRILLAREVDSTGDAQRLLVGSVYPRYLWTGGQDSLAANTHLCIFNEDREVLVCTHSVDGVVPEAVVAEISRDNHAGSLEWELEGERYIASYWTMPLDRAYALGRSLTPGRRVPDWKVMLSESRDVVLAPMASFRRAFPLIVLNTLWIVLLLSIGQIRRSLVPLDKLQEGTRRIAARDFDTRVDVTSGDEFEELADSFNNMAGRLGKQFTALSTIAEIDRAILSTLDIERIVRTVLERTTDLIACKAVSVTLVSPDQQKVPRTYTLRSTSRATPWVETTRFSVEDLRAFEATPEFFSLGPEDGRPAYATPLARTGCEHLMVFPMFINEEASGVVVLGFAGAPAIDTEDIEQIRQVTDQVAVALSNTHLVEDLDALNWGALTALARAVDAKSPWTAGHSERVTSMALKIAEVMKLGDDEIDIIHRGGLLHDIGKIGVPAAILDKPGKLTDEEYDVMKKHPETGAKILQPIAAYADVLPIVRHHHERWDGAGYPDGLAGNQIHPHARITAVADVYDAISSERPYRQAMPLEKAIGIIVAGKGTAFDAEVVDAFLGVMRKQPKDPGDKLLANG